MHVGICDQCARTYAKLVVQARAQLAEDAQGDGKQIPVRPPVLGLTNVSYLYPSTDREVLHRITLDLPSNSLTLVAGPSGAGKSTLALLLAGLMVPAEGSIDLDGRQVANEEELHSVATLIPQESVLLNTTILENLWFGSPDASLSEIRHAIRLLHLDDLIARLPDDLDTIVGARGYELSGGERQRLAVARGLLSPHPVVLLDEATSAIDSMAAQYIHDGIREYCDGRTLVIISHRIPRLREQDRVILLDQGRVTEYGLHGELMEEDSTYRKLHLGPAEQFLADVT